MFSRFGVQNFIALAIGFAAVLLVASCTTPSKDRDEAEWRLRIGTAHLAQGNYPYAMSELLAAEKQDPENMMVQNNLGLVYFFLERYEQAAAHFARAMKLKPNFSEARNNYARTLIELGRYDEAIAALNKVLADLTYPDPAKAWVNLGMAYFRKNDFTTARDKFAQAIRVNRGNCLAQTFFGRTLLELGALSDAAQALDNAVVICRPNKFDEPHYFSGLTYYKMGRTSSAIARMEEIMHLYPEGRYAKRAESMLKLMK